MLEQIKITFNSSSLQPFRVCSHDTLILSATRNSWLLPRSHFVCLLHTLPQQTITKDKDYSVNLYPFFCWCLTCVDGLMLLLCYWLKTGNWKHPGPWWEMVFRLGGLDRKLRRLCARGKKIQYLNVLLWRWNILPGSLRGIYRESDSTAPTGRHPHISHHPLTHIKEI